MAARTTQHTEAHSLYWVNPALYAGLLFLALFLAALTLGTLWMGKYSGWAFLFFDQLCHQDPARSFHWGGTAMAVCSRCLGIYIFFLFGVLILPFVAYFLSLSGKALKGLLLFALLLNAIDIAGNISGFWANTLHSRFLLGSIFGLCSALILTPAFFQSNKSEIQDGK